VIRRDRDLHLGRLPKAAAIPWEDGVEGAGRLFSSPSNRDTGARGFVDASG
jgi:hypothetical protein